MTSNVSNTAAGIIQDAMVANGKLPAGSIPTSQQFADCMRRLNDMINLWQTQGLKLFLQRELTVPLVVGQTLYTIGPTGNVIMPKPTRILQGFILNTTNIRRPLYIISRDEWERLSQVSGNNGTINSFMVDKQEATLNLNVWPPPDSTEVLNTAIFLAQYQATNPIALTDDVGFPQEWRIALMWGLADELATGQPQAIMDRCERRAMEYRQALQNWDVEDAPTYFNIDTRMNQAYGKFR